MGGVDKLHVGFPEKALDKYLGLLVAMGCKVAVIEQTETPRELEVRNRELKSAGKKPDKCVNRDITQVATVGTFQRADQGYEPKYILAYKRQ